MQNEFYFTQFENRTPPKPTQYNPALEFFWQVFATAALAVGLWYLHWRWTASLNPDALIFSTLVASAETLAFIGLALFFNNLWKIADTPQTPPPTTRAECLPAGGKGFINVDIFITTHDENPEIVRLSIRDAMNITIPKIVNVQWHLLDDGNRLTMRKIALEEEINYVTRANNLGFKAGNLKNALEMSSGDFVVICDADTRLFPGFLLKTLGYFCDAEVAWVQTPHWFFDIPKGRSLGHALAAVLGRPGLSFGRWIESWLGPVRFGADPFSSDPGLFFDVIQRRRNPAGASFCCGAGSIHRREAIYEVALAKYSDDVEGLRQDFQGPNNAGHSNAKIREYLKPENAGKSELTPYRFHVSEDFYTSIFLHAYKGRRWKSVYHPEVLCKMLSPWSLQSWAVQNFKYAGGTLDILINDNPLIRRGLKLQQRLLYGATFWSYLSPVWIMVLLLAPIITMATGLAPVQSYSSDFYLHLVPFLLLHEVATVLGTWGHRPMRGKMLNVTSFAIILHALSAVLRKRQIKFPSTPKEMTGGRHLHIVRFHMALIGATVLAFALALNRNIRAPDPEALAALIVNGFWGLNNILALWLLVAAAYWRPPLPRPKIKTSQELPHENC